MCMKKKIIARLSNLWSNNYIYYESNGDRNKTVSVEEYIKKIRPYLNNIINLKTSDTWEIQLIIANNDEERVMLSKSDNIWIMTNDEGNEFIKELLDSLKNKYQNKLILL